MVDQILIHVEQTFIGNPRKFILLALRLAYPGADWRCLKILYFGSDFIAQNNFTQLTHIWNMNTRGSIHIVSLTDREMAYQLVTLRFISATCPFSSLWMHLLQPIINV
ncbi:hypothetical protein ACJX0J_006083 [Zea mays]